MKVLVIGSGGREHALAWKMRKSQHVTWLGVAPGNGGVSNVAETVNIAASDGEGIRRFVAEHGINLVVVGPEAPLASGIADDLQAGDCYVFGPGADAARVESSKRFAKELMASTGIPTASFSAFTDPSTAVSYIRAHSGPLVVKASGLAAGKGVFVCDTAEEAVEAVETVMVRKAFGDAGSEVIIEERLDGPEVSLQVITDGTNYLTLPPAQDHKRIGEGDTGPNTGGMGAFCPAPIMDEELTRRCGEEIIEPALRFLREAGTPYRGLLYAGLILTADGPRVLEFNCRFGDPETQVVLPLLSVDLVDLMLLSVSGKLGDFMRETSLAPHDWKRISRTGYAATVILASKGYPGPYERGKEIHGLPAEQDDVIVFHAGTRREGNKLFTSGGRVLAVTAIGGDLETAIAKAYNTANRIQFEGKTMRRDIGWKALNPAMD